MAGSTTKSRDNLGHKQAATRDVAVQYNKLVADVEILRAGLEALVDAYNATLAKLDADAGVTDVNYAATNPGVKATFDDAAELLAAKVGNPNGTAITA